MNIFKRFRKNISLRLVNLLALSVIFACLLLSGDYLKKERSYDRHNLYADRTVRLSLRFGEEAVDGRLIQSVDDYLSQIPEVEKTVKLEKIATGVLSYQDEKQVVNDFYIANAALLEVFSIPLVDGTAGEALKRPNEVVVSEKYAHQLFGTEQAVGKEIRISSRKMEGTFFVSGVFKDFPETAHFHAELIAHRPDDTQAYTYHYLLLKEGSNIRETERKITELLQQDAEDGVGVAALLMPLTDIHLHSRVLRELERNGNSYYLYLIMAANALLLTVALFNLWLNTRLLFSYHRRYYQLLRLHGASAGTVIRDEAKQALLLGLLSLLAGGLVACLVTGRFPAFVSPVELGMGCLLFLLLVMAVSLLPVIRSISLSLFLNTTDDLKPVRFSYANVKYMLTAQYAIVVFVIIVAFGISRQMAMVRQSQVGGDDPHILVMEEQPTEVQERYDLLKAELLNCPAIQSVTASFQLPGEAIRDGVWVKTEDNEELKYLPVMVAGEDFLPFFHIRPLAGRIFHPGKMTYREEEARLFKSRTGEMLPDMAEEYMLTKKALPMLGFNHPEEAIGRPLSIVHPGGLEYIKHGIICGITDNFNYTGLKESVPPLLILQRHYFLHCIMVRLDPQRMQEALDGFNAAWQKINPHYPANYSFMHRVYGQLYYNELHAERLVYIFSLLCLLIANLGLIVFMAFIIKRRTREIAIRKVNGATSGEVVQMLNLHFVRWILLAFIVAAPVAGYVIHHWLKNFAYRTPVVWWLFLLAGITVLALSLLSVSLQSWRAATANPAKNIKTE